MIGRKIKNRYYLLERLGGGGEGTVYLARDEELGKYWAVKKIPADRREEMQILRRLSHSMLPQIVDYVLEEHCAYLVMEYIQGESLEQVRQRKPCTREQVIRWGIQLCQVLEYLHTRYPAVFHLDVKPSNILLTEQGELYLIDLGSCALAGEGKKGKCDRGTVEYAAPEQLKGEANRTCDIYSLGKTMEVLVGSRGHAGEELWKVIKKCQQTNWEQRYQSCRELEKELRNLTKGERRYYLLLAVLLGFIVVVFAGEKVASDLQTSSLNWEQESGRETFLENYTEIQNQIRKGLLMDEGQARKFLFEENRDALENLLRAAEGSEEKTAAHLSLARVCRELGDEGAAMANYDWLVQEEWERSHIACEYGLYLMEIGNREASKKLYGSLGVDEKSSQSENLKKWEEALYGK